MVGRPSLPERPPRVSIIVNCLNGQQFLREALDSVSCQTFSDWEVVFWDNASTDDSAVIASSHDHRVRYFRSHVTTTLGEARRRAVEQARGELVAFLDCDDVWFPHTLETLVSAMDSGPWAVCYGGFLRINESGYETGRFVPPEQSGDLFGSLLRQFQIAVPAVMLRRSVLEKTGLSFDANAMASEEYCLFMQLAATEAFKALSQPVAKYRVHDGSLTNQTIERWGRERDYTLKRIIERHPGIVRRHHREFREAFARARYYRARWLVAQNRRFEALTHLAPCAYVNVRYAVLTITLLFPKSLWNSLHRWRTKRGTATLNQQNN
jgi:glycosyltransferase involved in cell wall biosynthesis